VFPHLKELLEQVTGLGLLQFEVIPKERVLFLNMHRFVQYFLF
jgi:hypothetical protein